ncbi:MarR family winged helix-turn-helix transcriptional regulator [Streptomyces sp. NPDC058401]|uniref:MarR family winged helix-turn-helix transcriptional regulator n=1 Tax=Streptomyces sp. NPDC058401 TaxID=3346480 RepID=UPI0036596C31
MSPNRPTPPSRSNRPTPPYRPTPTPAPQLPPDLAAQELSGAPDGSSDRDRRLASALERAGHALRTLIWTQTTAHGLSPIQVQLLLRLGVEPPERRRVDMPASEFDLSTATVSEALAALRRKGLVEKRPVAGDKRGHVMAPTEAGLGRLFRILPGPRRLAPHLAALPRRPRTPSTRTPRQHAQARHQTPRTRPTRSERDDLAAAAALAHWPDPVTTHLATLPTEDKGRALRLVLDLVGHLADTGVLSVARTCTTCRFFRRDEHDDARRPHHCALLDSPIGDPELRVDCPEHQPA